MTVSQRLGSSEIDLSVSVIIPTIGRPEYLRKCLESITKQTLKVSEVIIVDASDNSDTYNEILSFCARGDVSCKYYKYHEPSAAAQRNFGVEQSCGSWLMFV